MPTPQEIAAAEAYEDLFVGGLFGEWAPRVADASGVAAGDRALDVACGTGVLSRELSSRVGSQGEVVRLDAAAGMLAVAAHRAPSIEWQLGVAETLPFEDDSFDVVVSQFGLMFFADRRQALEEVLRVLRPGGGLAIAVWDGLEANPAYAVEIELLDRLVGSTAADALRAPFVLADTAELATLFAAIGLPEVEIDTIPGKGRFPSIRRMVEADLRGWLPLMGVVLSETEIEGILAAAESDLGPFLSADGGVEFLSTAHIVGATAPGNR